MKKIIFQKIHFGVALLNILAVSVMSLTTLFSLMLYDPTSAEAAFGSSVGLEILSPPIKCVLNSVDGNCLASCPICGDIASCNGLFEVKARVLSGVNLLYKTQALCLTSPIPPTLGTFRPASRCLGKYFLAANIHLLFNFGCYR